jgi:hypothetical protein
MRPTLLCRDVSDDGEDWTYCSSWEGSKGREVVWAVALAGVADGSAGAPRVCETCRACTDCRLLTLLSFSLFESWDLRELECDAFSDDGWLPILNHGDLSVEMITVSRDRDRRKVGR